MEGNWYNAVTDELIRNILGELQFKAKSKIYSRNDYKYYRGPWLLSINSFLARLAYISGIQPNDLERYVREILKKRGLTKEPWLYEEERKNIYECTAPKYLMSILNDIYPSYTNREYFKISERLNLSVKQFKQHIAEEGNLDVINFLKAYAVSNIGIINCQNRNNLILSERLLSKGGNWSNFITKVLCNFQYICEESLSYLIEADEVITSDINCEKSSNLKLIFKEAYQESLSENRELYGELMPDIKVYKYREQTFNEFDMMTDDFKYLQKDGKWRQLNRIGIINECIYLAQSIGDKSIIESNSNCKISSLPFFISGSSPITYSIYIALFAGLSSNCIGDMNYYILSDINVQRLIYGNKVVKQSVFKYNDIKPIMSTFLKINIHDSVRECFRERLESAGRYNELQCKSFIDMYAFLIKSEYRFTKIKEYKYDLLKLLVGFCTIRDNSVEKGKVIDVSNKQDYCIEYIINFIRDNVQSRSPLALDSSINRVVDYFEIIKVISKDGLRTFIKSILCIDNFENGYPYSTIDLKQTDLTLSSELDDICATTTLSSDQLIGLYPIKLNINGIDYNKIQVLWDKISDGVKEQGVNNQKAYDMFFKDSL